MKSQVKILLILFLVLVAVFAYASFWNGDNDENIIKKISLSELTADVSLSDDTVALSESDSVLTAKQQPEVSPLDTTPQNILLFGESMVEGLSRPFADYCTSNGHQFNSVCWYSSTTKHWAKTDTLRYFLNKFNPTYVLISVGGNEQFVKDLDVSSYGGEDFGMMFFFVDDSDGRAIWKTRITDNFRDIASRNTDVPSNVTFKEE